jgi:hypothetical protein
MKTKGKITRALVAILVLALIIGTGAAYAAPGDPGWGEWEDCDSDCYDDATGVPVPWAGFDWTRGDTVPADWDGIAGSYPKPEEGAWTGDGTGGGGTGGGGSGTDGGGSTDPGGSGSTGTGGTGSGTEQTASSGDDNDLVKVFSKTPKPVIKGTARVGKTLKVSAGKWVSGTKLTYKWYANGKAIKGATKAKLKLKKAQQGKKITVKVTAKKKGYVTVTVKSKATRKVKKK